MKQSSVTCLFTLQPQPGNSNRQLTVLSALSILGQELVPPTVRMGLPAPLHLIRYAQRLVSEVTLDLVMLLILTLTMKPSQFCTFTSIMELLMY